MSNTAIAAIGAAILAVYPTFRARVVLWQDGMRPGPAIVIALTVGAVIWVVMFFGLLFILEAV